MTAADAGSIAPALILAIGGVVAALVAIPGRVDARPLAWLGAAASLVAATAAVAIGPSADGSLGFGGTVARDGASVFLVTLVGVVAAASLALLAGDPRPRRRSADAVSLVLFSASGAALAVTAADLVVLFAAIALLVIPLHGRSLRPFVLGAVSTAVVVYGSALLYAAAGETAYAGLGRATHNPLYLAGLGLVLAGLTSHLILAPAQRTAIVANVAIAGALLRLVAATRTGAVALDWEVSLATLAAVALTITGLAAFTERRVRRLIAYATLSQLGYVTMALAGSAAAAAAFALATYAMLAIVLFAVLAILPAHEPTLTDLAGLARRRPLLVCALGVAVLGLIGIPPAASFIAKLYVFEAAVRAQLLWLVIVGTLTTAVNAAAYVRLVLACLAPSRLDAVAPARARVHAAVAAAAAVAIVGVGLFPGPLLEAAQAVQF